MSVYPRNRTYFSFISNWQEIQSTYLAIENNRSGSWGTLEQSNNLVKTFFIRCLILIDRNSESFNFGNLESETLKKKDYLLIYVFRLIHISLQLLYLSLMCCHLLHKQVFSSCMHFSNTCQAFVRQSSGSYKPVPMQSRGCCRAVAMQLQSSLKAVMS